MTTTFIELGGVKRPVRFGFEGLLAYEQKTGRKALADFAQLSEADTVSVTLMVDLVWCGLHAGYRKEGIPQDFDEYDIAAWLGESPDAFEQVAKVFAESFPKAEKKTTPRPAAVKAAN